MLPSPAAASCSSPSSATPPTGDRLLATYAAHHRILLVGEGDLSFAEALCDQLSAGASGGKSRITATALDTEAELSKKYPAGIADRLARLRARGVAVTLGVDATTMTLQTVSPPPPQSHDGAAAESFDRIVYNFPYAHVTKFSKEFRAANLGLLRQFFARAATMLTAGGEVHVRNKTTEPYRGWDLQSLLPSALTPVGDAPFDAARFPGYGNASNWGGAARAYTVQNSRTFVFRRADAERAATPPPPGSTRAGRAGRTPGGAAGARRDARTARARRHKRCGQAWWRREWWCAPCSVGLS